MTHVQGTIKTGMKMQAHEPYQWTMLSDFLEFFFVTVCHMRPDRGVTAKERGRR